MTRKYAPLPKTAADLAHWHGRRWADATWDGGPMPRARDWAAWRAFGGRRHPAETYQQFGFRSGRSRGWKEVGVWFRRGFREAWRALEAHYARLRLEA